MAASKTSPQNTDVPTDSEPAGKSDETFQPWALSLDEVGRHFDCSLDTGLTDDEAAVRRRKHGRNRLREKSPRSIWNILVDQFKSIIILLLAIAATASFLFSEWVEGFAIIAAIFINAGIGFVMELRAVKSMQALRSLSRVTAKVRRNGEVVEVPAQDVVPGDIMLFEGGDIVTADVRLAEASKLQSDESMLTGESVPVTKQTGALDENSPAAERDNMLYKGTAVTRGSGEGIVVATGMDTQLGEIASLVDTAEEELTPLEKRLDRLGRRLIWLTLAVAGVTGAIGIHAGKDLLLMIETSIALAVAAIPEGLPIVATVALARGMKRMARRNALVNRLSSVETLGATSVICADKTGTLTENRMTVSRFDLAAREILVDEQDGTFRTDGETLSPDDDILRHVLEVGVLCNNAALSGDADDEAAVGDPMEVALLRAGQSAGMTREELLRDHEELREVAFDSETKMMATFHRTESGVRVAVKGAAESVLDTCDRIRCGSDIQPLDEETRDRWLKRNEELAENGLRVLALAERQDESEETEPYERNILLGLVGLQDPPREEVREAIHRSKQAGINVIMVTGDQEATAVYVARAVNLVEDDPVDVIHGRELGRLDELSDEEIGRVRNARVFVRVSPRQKLDLIAAHQDAGAIVAMTGDGVNDAPALKKADIGVAMGKRGTEVACEAADMILKDDKFATIVTAVEEGRVIFANIRRFVLYLMSGNFSEILVVGIASLAGAPLPLLPLQILFLNMIADVFPALALGVASGERDVMQRPPRDPDEAVLTRAHWHAVAGYGTLIAAAVLGAFTYAIQVLELGTKEAVTVSFLSLAFARFLHVFNMRSRSSGILRNDIVRNVYVWAALAFCTLLVLGSMAVPVLSNLLRLSDPGWRGWVLIGLAAVIPLLAGQSIKTVMSRIRSSD